MNIDRGWEEVKKTAGSLAVIFKPYRFLQGPGCATAELGAGSFVSERDTFLHLRVR